MISWKFTVKPEKNCRYYLKCSNNFAADCTLFKRKMKIRMKDTYQKGIPIIL